MDYWDGGYGRASPRHEWYLNRGTVAPAPYSGLSCLAGDGLRIAEGRCPQHGVEEVGVSPAASFAEVAAAYLGANARQLGPVRITQPQTSHRFGGVPPTQTVTPRKQGAGAQPAGILPLVRGQQALTRLGQLASDFGEGDVRGGSATPYLPGVRVELNSRIGPLVIVWYPEVAITAAGTARPRPTRVEMLGDHRMICRYLGQARDD